MHIRRPFAVLLLALALAPAATAQTRNPLGETADYELDRSPSRTSGLILDGSMATAVTDAMPADPEGPMYEVTIDWSLRIQILGNQSGTRVVKVPEVYFTPEFMADLRVDGEYVGPSFKLRHLGFADARNLDGAFYPNCDKVLIYDIEDAAQPQSNDIEDMEILAHISYGVPVLGAVKMDVSGRYQGQRVKAGADYETP